MSLNIIFFLFLSAQAVFSKTSSSKYRKDEPFNLLQDLYDAMPKCNVDKNLFEKAKAHILNTQPQGSYVESQEVKFEERDPETKLQPKGSHVKSQDDDLEEHGPETRTKPKGSYVESDDDNLVTHGPETKPQPRENNLKEHEPETRTQPKWSHVESQENNLETHGPETKPQPIGSYVGSQDDDLEEHGPETKPQPIGSHVGSQADILEEHDPETKPQLKGSHVGSQEDDPEEHDPETRAKPKGSHDGSQKTNLETHDLETKKIESFLMVSGGFISHRTRDVYKVSMKSNTTEKTGIMVKNVLSISYDRKSNLFFWSQSNGIFKQLLCPNSVKKRISSQTKAYDLNVSHEKLFYRVYLRRRSCIFSQDHTRKEKDLWLTLLSKINVFVINEDIGCWAENHRGESIVCVEMSTKRKIYNQEQPHSRHVYDLALLRTLDFGMLVYLESGKGNKCGINIVEITAKGEFGNPNTVSYVNKGRKIKVKSGLLVFSECWNNKVEIWEMSQNGSLGRKTFTTRYPGPSNALTVRVELL